MYRVQYRIPREMERVSHLLRMKVGFPAIFQGGFGGSVLEPLEGQIVMGVAAVRRSANHAGGMLMRMKICMGPAFQERFERSVIGLREGPTVGEMDVVRLFATHAGLNMIEYED